MALYIHLYENARGKFDGEVGIAENCDDAMQWLDDYHDNYVRAGAKYLHTLIVMDMMADQSMTYRRNLLADLDRWRTEKFNEARAEREHDQAVMHGVRRAQL